MMHLRERLRIARTNIVHRWHAAHTVGERLGNGAVGERFEHINHAKSLAEYIWRYGVFEESIDGTGRVARQDVPRGLRDVVAPVAAKGRTHLRLAARYAMVITGGDADTVPPGDGNPAVAERSEHLDLRQYAEEHPDIEVFARRVSALHRAMLRYYVQMRFLTPAEAQYCGTHPIPLFEPIGGVEERGAEQRTPDEATEVPEDPVILSPLFAVRSRATSTTPSSHERGPSFWKPSSSTRTVAPSPPRRRSGADAGSSRRPQSSRGDAGGSRSTTPQ